MRFWDSSALVPLLLHEPQTKAIRDLFQEDRTAVVWAGTAVELASAVWRRTRAGELTDPARTAALANLADVERTWECVVDFVPVAARARRVLAVHPLRAADALQLAAALQVSRERPTSLPFVTLDDRLADAARREGFPVLPAT